VSEKPECKKRALGKLKLMQFFRTASTLHHFGLSIKEQGKGYEPVLELPLTNWAPFPFKDLALNSAWAISLLSL
jgi:hypothetical protein